MKGTSLKQKQKRVTPKLQMSAFFPENPCSLKFFLQHSGGMKKEVPTVFFRISEESQIAESPKSATFILKLKTKNIKITYFCFPSCIK